MNIFRHGISQQERLFFTKHLATMLKTGIPITEALESIGSNSESSNLKTIVTQIKTDVENGYTLSDAFAKHGEVFNGFYQSLVRVGEKSGTLEANLQYLADHLAKEYTLKKKIQNALLYPALILITLIIIGAFIVFYLLPQLVDFFDAFETELPLSTQILLYIANVVKDYGFIIMGGIVLLLVLSFVMYKIPWVQYLGHRLIISVPLVGAIIRYQQESRSARNLGLLLKSGLPIVTSIETTINSINNKVFQRALLNAKTGVEEGKQLNKVLSMPFSPILIKMVEVGEKTGNLDATLMYVADYYNEEIEDVSRNLTTIMEPVMLIIIGLAVGFIALAIISPVYQLTGTIR